MGQSVSSTTKTPAQDKAKLFDWLADYDHRVEGFDQAPDWTVYSYFAFARFPKLRPKARVAAQDEGYRVFSQTLRAWADRIDAHCQAQRVLNGLNSRQHRQLAALVSDTVIDLETFKNRKKSRNWARNLRSQLPSRERMLESKYRDACQALKKLRAYSAKQDSILASIYKKRAEKALGPLRDSLPPRSSKKQTVDSIYADLRETTRDPTTDAMVQLYWFFRSGCSLNGNESEVRVALIRNAFWISLGVPKVAFLSQYEGTESKGCRAVRQAVRRFHPR
jgi:hypothetical protein